MLRTILKKNDRPLYLEKCITINLCAFSKKFDIPALNLKSMVFMLRVIDVVVVNYFFFWGAKEHFFLPK